MEYKEIAITVRYFVRVDDPTDSRTLTDMTFDAVRKHLKAFNAEHGTPREWKSWFSSEDDDSYLRQAEQEEL